MLLNRPQFSEPFSGAGPGGRGWQGVFVQVVPILRTLFPGLEESGFVYSAAANINDERNDGEELAHICQQELGLYQEFFFVSRVQPANVINCFGFDAFILQYHLKYVEMSNYCLYRGRLACTQVPNQQDHSDELFGIGTIGLSTVHAGFL